MADAARGLVPLLLLMSNGMGALSKAFYQKYGKDALPIVEAVMSQGGVEWGKIMQQTLPAKSMKVVAEQQKMMSPMMGSGLEILDVSDNRFHFTMAKCPLGLEGSSRELCEAAMAIDQKRLSTFFGQEVEVKVA